MNFAALVFPFHQHQQCHAHFNTFRNHSVWSIDHGVCPALQKIAKWLLELVS